MDHLVARKDCPIAELVEKQQTPVENGSPLETTRSLIENETSWENQVDEEDLKNSIM